MKRFLVSLLKASRSLTARRYHAIKNTLFKAVGPDLKYRRFHSQFGEDRYLFETLGLPRIGTFVDVGAGHPIRISNTYFLEQNGWTGLCIDADPSQVELLRKCRTNVEWAAVSDREGEIEFQRAYLPDFSASVANSEQIRGLKVPTKETIRVQAFRLETLLEKHSIGKIDLLDIDVEGVEINVWQSFDYQLHAPTVVVMECETFGMDSNSEAIRSLFASLPYELVHTTCANLIFKHR